MPKFEFYRANASYFRKIFYYRYIGYINLLKSLIKLYLKILLLPGLVLLVLNYFVYDQSIPFRNFALKLAIIAAIPIIVAIITIILGFLILLVAIAWKHLYITGYSLLKEEQEIPTILRIKRRLFFLDFFPTHPVITIILGFLISFSVLYLLVSFLLKWKYTIPLF